jgi:crotonobetainyl-CoA:carnitine CoA-transferase CaiB-like acyl-CoA transferase
MSASPATIRRAPPLIGEHNAEVLAELGYGEERIAELKDAKIV